MFRYYLYRVFSCIGCPLASGSRYFMSGKPMFLAAFGWSTLNPMLSLMAAKFVCIIELVAVKLLVIIKLLFLFFFSFDFLSLFCFILATSGSSSLNLPASISLKG